MNQIKRHFYNGIDYVVDEENKIVKLLPEFHEKLKTKKLWGKFGFKKIGGSSVGDILEVNQYSSTFTAFCRLAWIGLPILDRKYVDAGIAIESKVINSFEEATGMKVTTYNPKAYNFDFFADKDEIFGGLPDGYIEDKNILLEIKTSGLKNYEKWKNNGVPMSYLKQSQLYSYLIGADKFVIAAVFLEEQDYLKPENFPIKERKKKTWSYVVDKAQVLDDMSKARAWYIDVTNSGVSPEWNDFIDKDLIKYLKVTNKEEQETLLHEWRLEGKYVQ